MVTVSLSSASNLWLHFDKLVVLGGLTIQVKEARVPKVITLLVEEKLTMPTTR